MAYNHNHECQHGNIKFCKKCQKPYCEECGREWEEKCLLNHNWWYVYPTSVPTTNPLYPTWSVSDESVCTHSN